MSTGVGAVTSVEGAKWCKSSYSGNSNACVEIARSPDVVNIRDTKARSAGTIALRTATWIACRASRSWPLISRRKHS